MDYGIEERDKSEFIQENWSCGIEKNRAQPDCL